MATTRDKTPGSAKKTDGVQGEGDYVSARKYNERTQAFVKEHEDGKQLKKQPPVSEAELAEAEKEALARSRGQQQDRKDARVMRDDVQAADARQARKGKASGRAT